MYFKNKLEKINKIAKQILIEAFYNRKIALLLLTRLGYC